MIFGGTGCKTQVQKQAEERVGSKGFRRESIPVRLHGRAIWAGWTGLFNVMCGKGWTNAEITHVSLRLYSVDI